MRASGKQATAGVLTTAAPLGCCLPAAWHLPAPSHSDGAALPLLAGWLAGCCCCCPLTRCRNAPRRTHCTPCRGLPERLVDSEAARLLKQLGLTEFADRACGSYSGGNRRKLSVAVALVGGAPVRPRHSPSPAAAACCCCCCLCPCGCLRLCPCSLVYLSDWPCPPALPALPRLPCLWLQVILLDEPSTGMDPGGWGLVSVCGWVLVGVVVSCHCAVPWAAPARLLA